MSTVIATKLPSMSYMIPVCKCGHSMGFHNAKKGCTVEGCNCLNGKTERPNKKGR